MVQYEYNSITDLLNQLEGSKIKSNFYPQSEGEGEKYDSDTLEVATQWITNGRPLHKLNLKEIKSEFASMQNEFVFQEFNSVSGAHVNMGEFLSGSPTSMIDYYQEEQPKISRVMQVAINMAVGYKTKNEDIVKAGKKILEAVNTLEAQGYSLEIYCIVTVRDKGKRVNNEYCLKVKIKNAGEPLNVSTFFSCVSTDFLRRFYFAFCEKLLKGESKKFSDNYGNVMVNHGTIQATNIIAEGTRVNTIIEQIIKANTNQLN